MASATGVTVLLHWLNTVPIPSCVLVSSVGDLLDGVAIRDLVHGIISLHKHGKVSDELRSSGLNDSAIHSNNSERAICLGRLKLSFQKLLQHSECERHFLPRIDDELVEERLRHWNSLPFISMCCDGELHALEDLLSGLKTLYQFHSITPQQARTPRSAKQAHRQPVQASPVVEKNESTAHSQSHVSHRRDQGRKSPPLPPYEDPISRPEPTGPAAFSAHPITELDKTLNESVWLLDTYQEPHRSFLQEKRNDHDGAGYPISDDHVSMDHYVRQAVLDEQERARREERAATVARIREYKLKEARKKRREQERKQKERSRSRIRYSTSFSDVLGLQGDTGGADPGSQSAGPASQRHYDEKDDSGRGRSSAPVNENARPRRYDSDGGAETHVPPATPVAGAGRTHAAKVKKKKKVTVDPHETVLDSIGRECPLSVEQEELVQWLKLVGINIRQYMSLIAIQPEMRLPADSPWKTVQPETVLGTHVEGRALTSSLVQEVFRNGIALVDLVENLEGDRLFQGVHRLKDIESKVAAVRKAGSAREARSQGFRLRRAECMHHITTVLEHLRQRKSMPATHLFVTDELYECRADVLWGLLTDLRADYSHETHSRINTKRKTLRKKREDSRLFKKTGKSARKAKTAAKDFIFGKDRTRRVVSGMVINVSEDESSGTSASDTEIPVVGDRRESHASTSGPDGMTETEKVLSTQKPDGSFVWLDPKSANTSASGTARTPKATGKPSSDEQATALITLQQEREVKHWLRLMDFEVFDWQAVDAFNRDEGDSSSSQFAHGRARSRNPLGLSLLDDPFRNGVLLCRLVQFLEQKPVLVCCPGKSMNDVRYEPYERPSSLAHARANIDAALRVLKRKKAHIKNAEKLFASKRASGTFHGMSGASVGVPSSYLWDREELLKGNYEHIYGLLWYAMRCYVHVPSSLTILDKYLLPHGGGHDPAAGESGGTVKAHPVLYLCEMLRREKDVRKTTQQRSKRSSVPVAVDPRDVLGGKMSAAMARSSSPAMDATDETPLSLDFEPFTYTRLPYTLFDFKRLEYAVLLWLNSLGVVSTPTGEVPSSYEDVRDQISDGTLLCDLVGVLLRDRITGIFRKPHSNAIRLKNIELAFSHIRNRFKGLSTRYLFRNSFEYNYGIVTKASGATRQRSALRDNGELSIEERLLFGDKITALCILEDLYRWYDGLPPLKSGASRHPYLGRRFEEMYEAAERRISKAMRKRVGPSAPRHEERVLLNPSLSYHESMYGRASTWQPQSDLTTGENGLQMVGTDAVDLSSVGVAVPVAAPTEMSARVPSPQTADRMKRHPPQPEAFLPPSTNVTESALLPAPGELSVSMSAAGPHAEEQLSQGYLLGLWLQSLGIALKSPFSLEAQVIPEFMDGLILCDLMEKLELMHMTGITKQPKSRASYLHNIRKALQVLQKKKTMPITHLSDEHRILEGNGAVIRALLEQMRKAYNHTFDNHATKGLIKKLERRRAWDRKEDEQMMSQSMLRTR